MAEVPRQTAPAGRPIDLLVVDDSAMMRMMITRVAGLCGIPIQNIHEAANGLEAIKVLETRDVDAVFTDISMPVMTGTELLREIAKHGRYRRLTRIVVSTDGSTARRNEARDLGVRLYVEKPFRPEVMRDVLAEIAACANPR